MVQGGEMITVSSSEPDLCHTQFLPCQGGCDLVGNWDSYAICIYLFISIHQGADQVSSGLDDFN